MKNYFILTAICFALVVKAQIHVNREWKATSAGPVFNPVLNQFGIQWSQTVAYSAGGLITVGHTPVTGQGENITLTRYDRSGAVIFQVDYNTASSHNDYGAAVCEGAGGDIYVCGTTDNGTSNTDYDVVVLRYDATGALVHSASYGGPSGMNDVGTAILYRPASADVIVAGTSESAATGYDYLVLKFNANTLSILGNNTYDYAVLPDVPVGITLSSGGDICLIGASASGIARWEYCVAVFDKSTLVYLSATRGIIPGVGFDQPLAFCKDAAQNMYVTGRASTDGINYNIRTMKILANFSIAWSVVFDGYGQEDAGNTIGIDPNGDIIVGGFVTDNNSYKKAICLKYATASGTLLWQTQQRSRTAGSDAFIKDLDINTANGDIYFTGGDKGFNGFKEVVLGKINTRGNRLWERTISESYDVLPSDILFDSNAVYLISVENTVSPNYQVTKYTEFTKDTDLVYNTQGVSNSKAHEIVVRFCAKAMNRAAIDNLVGTKISEYGRLKDFLTDSAYIKVLGAFSRLCKSCDLKAVKIFDHQLTTEKYAISRLGDTIPVPDFWTALTVVLPPAISIQQAHDAFNTIPRIVAYSHPNYIGRVTTAPPTDALYHATQRSLHAVSPYANAHINIEEAWDIYPRAGTSNVKCGVFDTGIDETHEDFDIGGATKIEGWDLLHLAPISAVNHPTGLEHGTQCAGIIGALRNNTVGIAGIAGGDFTGFPYDNTGIQLYSVNILGTDSAPFPALAIDKYADAITETAKDGLGPGTFYRYGLHLSSNSWVYQTADTVNFDDTYGQLLKDAFHFANRMKITVVAARDNAGRDNPVLPAILDDDWILCVGGTDQNGNYIDGSIPGDVAASYGHGVDVAAPAAGTLVSTCYPNDGYVFNAGTSMSAPHVAGVVGLLMSYMNPLSNFNYDYNNLAPEDCEFIIQKTATDVGAPGPDPYTGYGRLNAGKAMRLVEKPYHSLYHFGSGNSSTAYGISASPVTDTVLLTEPYWNLDSTWFHQGRYIVKTYQVNAGVSHVFPFPTDSLMYAWPRPSSSALFALFDANKRVQPRQRIVLNSCSTGYASLTGYVYEVKDTLGVPLGWWPCNLNFNAPGLGPLFEYSVLVKNTAVGIKKETKHEVTVKLFPNPASQSQTLVIDAKPGEDLSVHLYDIMGQHIKTVYSAKSTGAETVIINDVGGLPNSMYLYVISAGNGSRSIKFIKQ